MLKAVIFDMDGVLVDSEAIFYEADRLLMKNLGKEFDKEYYKQFVGTTCEYMWKKIIGDYELDVSVEYMEAEGSRIVKELLGTYGGFPEVPYAGDFVRRLAGVDCESMSGADGMAKTGKWCKLAIASSSSYASIERNMNNMRIRQYFDAIVSGEDMERPKPYPDVFLAAAEALGVKPSECVVIEDSHNGVLAAAAAGMACIGYVNPNSGNQDLSKADLLLLGFEDADFPLVDKVYCHRMNEPYRILTTDRLFIEEMSEKDVAVFKSMVEKEDIAEATGIQPEEFYNTLGNEAYMASYRENMYKFYGLGIWVLRRIEDGVTVGFAGVDDEMYLSYIVDRKYRRMGYCMEALEAICGYVWENTDAEYIYCKINGSNTASASVVKRLGFAKEADIWRKKNAD